MILTRNFKNDTPLATAYSISFNYLKKKAKDLHAKYVDMCKKHNMTVKPITYTILNDAGCEVYTMVFR